MRTCPDGIEPYERVNLAVEQIVTFPGFEHPDLRAMFTAPGEDLRSFPKHPVNNDGFGEALHELRANPFHQVGGYATPVQGPVEYEAAMAAVGGIAYDDPRVAAEQARRRPPSPASPCRTHRPVWYRIPRIGSRPM